MGRDLLCILRAQITFDLDDTAALKVRRPEAKTLILMVAQEEKWQLYTPERRLLEIPELPFRIPGAWAEDNPPGLARIVPPVVAELKPGFTPVSQIQYFIPCKTQVGIQKHFDRFLKYGPCQSSWNTPLLPIQKLGTGGFRSVQDLWAENSATVTLHPIVPNPYMILGLVPAEAKFFTY
jgi:hypothetical protein